MSLYEKRFWLKSYGKGIPHDIEIPDRPVRDFFKENVGRFPDKPYLIHNEETLSYATVNELACRLANGLGKLGVKKGDRVAFLMPNIPQHVIAIQAGYKAGTVNVGLNILYTVPELKQQINDSGATTLIVYTRIAEKAFELRKDPDCLLETVIVVTPRGEATVEETGSVFDFETLLANASAGEPEVDIASGDTAMLQYTGGTTGVSKACCLTNRNIMVMCRQYGTWIAGACPPEEVRNLCVVPLFHVYGWNTSVNLTLFGGGSIILVTRAEPELILYNINRHEPTIWCTVPRLVNMLINHEDTPDSKIDRIKAFFCGAAALPLEEMRRLKALSGSPVMEGYGTAETTNLITMNPVDNIREGTVGLPLPNTVVKIVDSESGRFVMPVGEPGEIVAKGPQIMEQYWNTPGETELAFTDDGYLYTGDIGCMDEEGFVHILDRKMDVVIRSGFTVYPREIDEVVYQLENIQEACTVGVPHETSGETVKTYVVLKPDTSLTVYQVREHCRRQLAAYKVPEIVEFVDEIPKTGIGKFDRKVLRTGGRITLDW
ncbi:MAG: long-chain fatty acid--CoA ligase [Desulfobacteraceae bacterium]|nr:long-chain fatty acid--CoA ligase [Desulfobacteraceae bacterium]